MNVTIRDVAKAAGVSVGTVSRAFNGYQDINSDTKQRVFDSAKELGYAPNVNARSLSAKKSPNIGMIVSGFLETNKKDNFISVLLQGVYRYSFEKKLEVALYTTDSRNQNKKTYTRFCVEHSIFGAILCGITTRDAYFNELVNSGMPCVLIDVHIKGKGLGCVSINNYEAASELAQYLIDSNHKKIVIISGKKNADVTTDRIAGIHDTFLKNGIELTGHQIIYCDFSEEIAYTKAKEYLVKHGKKEATAFLCLSDLMALGVMKAIRELKYSIPEDFSLVGFDGIPITEYTTPGLTTIQQDMDEIGYQAGALLEELMNNRDASKDIYVPYKFVKRDSVKVI